MTVFRKLDRINLMEGQVRMTTSGLQFACHSPPASGTSAWEGPRGLQSKHPQHSVLFTITLTLIIFSKVAKAIFPHTLSGGWGED